MYLYEYSECIQYDNHRATLTPEVIKDLTRLKNTLFFYDSLNNLLKEQNDGHQPTASLWESPG